MKLSRASVYAILSTIQLSESASSPPLPCSQLAKLGDMPERFLLQVLRSLVTHDILLSTRGVDGGYRLARPLSQITLLDIITATEGRLEADSERVVGLSSPSQQRLADLLSQIASDTRKRLASFTLAELKPASTR